MNQMINRGWIDTIIAPQRFNEGRRINNGAEALSYFKECKHSLLNISKWKTPIYFNDVNQIQHFDAYGFEVNRSLQINDVLKISFKYHKLIKNTMYLTVNNIKALADDLEEEMYLQLKEKTNFFNASQIAFGECQISLKRLVNTISMDIKIKPAFLKENEAKNESFIQDFEWNRLAKNIIAQF